jgi:hypothetical protein
MDAAKRDLSDAAFSLRGFNTRGNALQAPDGDDSDNSDNTDDSLGFLLVLVWPWWAFSSAAWL